MHPLVSKLGLSAAQFGLDGAGAPRRRSPEAEVRDMLAVADKAGIRVLDAGPASSHGEAVIGAVTPRPCRFRIMVRAARGDRGAELVEQEARGALARLGLSRADTIMLQAASDLFSAHGPAVWKRLEKLRDEGLFARIGVSAYASDDPLGLARRFRPDVVQAPASLLDQRLLVDGSLARIRDLGIEVHLRSMFLNGPLFRPPDRTNGRLAAAAARVSRARRMIAEGRSDPLQAALGFVLSRPEADAVVVGAATAAEVSAIVAAAAHPPPDLDWDDMALDDPEAFERPRGVAA